MSSHAGSRTYSQLEFDRPPMAESAVNPVPPVASRILCCDCRIVIFYDRS